MGDTHVGLQARLMSQALRKLTSTIHHSRAAVVFINQLREKVGVSYGSPEVTPGGRALKFYSSVRIDLRRTESIKQGSEIIGSRVRARVVKNKVAAPFRVTEFDIMFNQGISKMGDLLELGVNEGILKKAGAFYSYGETPPGAGPGKLQGLFVPAPGNRRIHRNPGAEQNRRHRRPAAGRRRDPGIRRRHPGPHEQPGRLGVAAGPVSQCPAGRDMPD